MIVAVRLLGDLRHFRPDKQERFTLELPGGATVRDLIAASAVPWEEVGMVAVNGQQVDDYHRLAEGDQVALLVPMEGG